MFHQDGVHVFFGLKLSHKSKPLVTVYIQTIRKITDIRKNIKSNNKVLVLGLILHHFV